MIRGTTILWQTLCQQDANAAIFKQPDGLEADVSPLMLAPISITLCPDNFTKSLTHSAKAIGILLFFSLIAPVCFSRLGKSSAVTSEVACQIIRLMKIAWIACLLAVIVGLAGCNLKEKYARNNLAADQWLQANRGPANVKIDGAWHADEAGGGDIRFRQVGSTLDGAMGNYSARGVIRGSQVLLALSSGGYVYYTVVLRASGDTLSGFYSSSVPFHSADQASVTLRRLEN